MIGGLGPEDLAWLAGAAFTAGLVRGFAGFGTAMIYLPIAGQILSPFAALTTIVVFDMIAPLPNVPRALKDGHPRDVVRLAIGLLLVLPLGLYTLSFMPPEAFRYTVSGIALTMLVLLMLGIRYRGPMTKPLIYATGGAGGFLMGVSGIPGPPVILLYMASPLPAHVIRANNLLYLILTDIIMLPFLALFGRLEGAAVLIGAALIVPSLLGNVLGGWLFRPGYERVYRGVAYGVIAVMALSGLPIWD